MRKFAFVIVFCGLAACAPEPAYMDESKDADYYRTHKSELIPDGLLCLEDRAKGADVAERCDELDQILRQLRNEEREAARIRAIEAAEEMNKKMSDAIESVELDLKWGN